MASLSLSFARRARLVKAEWRAGTKPEGSTRVFSRRAKEASVALVVAFRPTSSALRCRSRSIDRWRERERERESARFETVELTRSEYGSSGPAVSPHGVRPRACATRNSSGHEPGLRVGRRRSHHHALHDGSAPSKVALHHLRSAPLFRSCPFRLTCGEPTVWIRRHP